MFCKFCGNEIPNDAAVCTYCGRMVATPPPAQPAQSGKLPVVSLVLGIVGIVFALLIPFLGLIISIIGIVFGVKERAKTGKAVGLVLSIIGASLAGVIWLYSLIILATVDSFLDSFYYYY